MKNLCVVALMAAAAVNVLSAWALPLPPSTENYCPASAIAADLDLNANVSNRVYRSGSGCAVGANVLLNITAQNIAFEYISPDPTTIEFTDSSVGAAGAVDIRAPDFGFSGMMVPLIVRVLNNQFARNAVLHLHGCFPYNSVVTISGNTFAETSARNYAVDPSVGVAAISLGVTDDKFQNPLLFLPYTEVLISDNVIRNVVGAMGVETAGIAVIPSSFFMGNNTKFAIRNNVVETATGVSTNPVIPYSLKGFINVIPEYDGHHDAYFEFSGNTAPAVTNGIAWWMPGMWGPRGAHDLAINVTDNSAAISTVVGNDRYAAVHSTVNCTARGKFYYERNEISVTNTDQTPTIIFYPMLSEGQFVAIRDNTFSVNGAAAAINMQPWTGVGEAHVSGNRVTSVTGEATWRVSGINGTAAAVQFSDNTVDGTSVVCNFVDVSLLGGSVSLDSFVLSSRGNPVAINFGNVSLSNGAQLGVTRWAVTSFTSITFNMAGAVDLADDGTSFTFSGNNLTSSNGAAIVVLGRPTLTDASQIVVSTNRIRASGGSPNLRFNDLYVANNAAVLLSFNNLVRTDSSAMTSSYFIINGALSLLDNAEFGMWNNTMNAVNTGTIVGILQVIANFTASPNADVFICKNIYYPSAANLNVNQTLQMQLVVPAQLGALSKCDRFTTTPAPTTTATTTTRRPTTTQAPVTTETETDDVNVTTTVGPFPTGSNGAASRAVAAAVAIAAAVVCAALL